MNYIYDVNYGINEHHGKALPLAQVQMNEKEIYGPNTPHRSSLKDFRRYKIHSTFGLSWLQWLELPLEEAADIMEICKESIKEEAEIKDKTEADLARLTQ